MYERMDFLTDAFRLQLFFFKKTQPKASNYVPQNEREPPGPEAGVEGGREKRTATIGKGEGGEKEEKGGRRRMVVGKKGGEEKRQ